MGYAFSTRIIVEIRGNDNKENRRLCAIVVRTEAKDDSHIVWKFLVKKAIFQEISKNSGIRVLFV